MSFRFLRGQWVKYIGFFYPIIYYLEGWRRMACNFPATAHLQFTSRYDDVIMEANFNAYKDSIILWPLYVNHNLHYSDFLMSAMASQINSISIVYSTACSGAYQWKRQSSASLAFVTGIIRCPVNSPHKGPVPRKMFSFDDVTMQYVYENTKCKPPMNW